MTRAFYGNSPAAVRQNTIVVSVQDKICMITRWFKERFKKLLYRAICITSKELQLEAHFLDVSLVTYILERYGKLYGDFWLKVYYKLVYAYLLPLLVARQDEMKAF